MRKLIGSAALIAYLIVYIAVAVTIVVYVPDIAWLRLVYFALAGVVWVAPLRPLLRWMSAGQGGDPNSEP